MKPPEEPELDFGDEPDDPNLERDIPVVKFDRTELNVQGVGVGIEGWTSIREHLIAHRAEKGRGPDGVPLEKFRHETGEAAVTITERGHKIGWQELPTSGKSLARRASEKRWTLSAGRSATHVAATLYQSDSDQDADKSYQAGDVRYPAEDRVYFVLFGVLEAQGREIAAFRLYYESRPDEKSKTGYKTAFTYGEYRDITGPERFVALPGKSARDFAAWFDALVPPEKPRAKKDDRSKEERLLDGEEWQA